MSFYFLKSATTKSQGLQVIHESEGFTLDNLGPDGAVDTSNPRQTSICIAPDVVVAKEASVSKTKAGEFEGEFVVEVNGVIVPYIFTEDQLPEYFNEANTHGTGIVFEPVIASPAVSFKVEGINSSQVIKAYVYQYQTDSSDFVQVRTVAAADVPDSVLNDFKLYDELNDNHSLVGINPFHLSPPNALQTLGCVINNFDGIVREVTFKNIKILKVLVKNSDDSNSYTTITSTVDGPITVDICAPNGTPFTGTIATNTGNLTSVETFNLSLKNGYNVKWVRNGDWVTYYEGAGLTVYINGIATQHDALTKVVLSDWVQVITQVGIRSNTLTEIQLPYQLIEVGGGPGLSSLAYCASLKRVVFGPFVSGFQEDSFMALAGLEEAYFFNPVLPKKWFGQTGLMVTGKFFVPAESLGAYKTFFTSHGINNEVLPIPPNVKFTDFKI